MKWWYYLFFILVSPSLSAQESIEHYWIEFTDKKNTPYSIFRPSDYLSPRAIQKRQQQHIPIDSLDLPVSPTYLAALAEMDIVIRHTSKWLNAATVLTSDKLAETIKNLPFVRSVERVGQYHTPLKSKSNKRPKIDNDNNYERTSGYYGYGSLQIGMLNGHALHRLGYKGEDVYIGVQDGGFSNMDVMPFFDSLFIHNRILETKDFVDDDDYVYESASHGTSVLSVMAGNIPFLFVGTAPSATYLCMKTEDVRSETLTEECNWVAALEYADSIGVDVVNSSLGYTQFSEEAMNYSYKDLNGQTSRASKAADIAVDKGIFVVNSAGNSGAGAWRFVGTPADSRNIFSIGAVTTEEIRASFSSFGPTSDGRIKPNIAALGQGTIIAGGGFNVGTANGTSVASPIIAGLVAALKQAFPHKSNQEIRVAIEESSHQAASPDNVLGYGIPNFYIAYRLLKGKKVGLQSLEVYPDEDKASIVFLESFQNEGILTIQNVYGEVLKKIELSPKQLFEQITVDYPFSKGVYYLTLETSEKLLKSFFIQ